MSERGQRILDQIQQRLTRSTMAAKRAGWDDVDITSSGTVVVRKYASKDAADFERQRLNRNIPAADHETR